MKSSVSHSRMMLVFRRVSSASRSIQSGSSIKSGSIGERQVGQGCRIALFAEEMPRSIRRDKTGVLT